ncbi:MAG TPA: hypothetical protein VGB85_06940, partial [Nannocystis sp.]
MRLLRLGVRGKLFVVSVSLVLAVVLLSGLYLERQLVEWAQTRAQVELEGHARLVRVLLEREAEVPGPADLDALADRAAAPIDARVTIIAADGRVLGDSEFAAEALATMESHSDRPEVLGALRDGQGVAQRTSASLTTEMLYVALPFPDAGGEGVVRVARPLREVDAAVRRLWIAFTVAGVFAVAGAVLLSGLASHYLSRTLRGLVQDARRMVETGEKS